MSKNWKWRIIPVCRLNALVYSFCHNHKKCGTERVNSLELQMLLLLWWIMQQWLACCWFNWLARHIVETHNHFGFSHYHVVNPNFFHESLMELLSCLCFHLKKYRDPKFPSDNVRHALQPSSMPHWFADPSAAVVLGLVLVCVIDSLIPVLLRY